MASHLCFFKNPLSWVSILSPLLLGLAGFKGGIFSIFVPSIVVVLLSIIFIFKISKPKPSLVEKVVASHDQQDYPSNSGDDIIAKTLEQPENVSISEKEMPQEEECEGKIDEYLVQTPPPPFFLSESEYLGRSSTSEDSEVDWSLQDKMFRSPDCSDGSISDEESFIEIALPSGLYVCSKVDGIEAIKQCVCGKEVNGMEATKEGNYMKWQEFEMGNDMNEEENLIEIDLSIGSIKSPRRFEIEA